MLDLYRMFAHCARSKVMTPVRYSNPLSCLRALERVLRRPRILMLTHLDVRIRDGIFIMAAESLRAFQRDDRSIEPHFREIAMLVHLSLSCF